MEQKSVEFNGEVLDAHDAKPRYSRMKISIGVVGQLMLSCELLRDHPCVRPERLHEAIWTLSGRIWSLSCAGWGHVANDHPNTNLVSPKAIRHTKEGE
jgi:hypothetical protein